MRKFTMFLICGITTICFTAGHAQGLLRKIKQKAESVTDKMLDKKTDETVNGQNGGNTSTGSTTGSSKNNPSNKGGQGLVTTPPDVNENLSSAETAFKSGSYGEARYAVQQAMLGVEMEIGQRILKSLPETVAGLKKNAADDQVTSTGWGWVGLTIRREYQEGDKQFTVTVANNAAWMQAVNLYLNNAGYSQTTGGEQKVKQVKVKGYRSVIEYSEGSGYKISLPLGQTSLMMFEGINFGTEQDIINAVNQIDIDRIKTQLGEK
ncbi:MAG: hypothetical protein WKF97_09500 [Chitinophagaceae bacterium]